MVRPTPPCLYSHVSWFLHTSKIHFFFKIPAFRYREKIVSTVYTQHYHTPSTICWSCVLETDFDTHTHTQKIHSPTCHQLSFHFKVYLGQQALDGPVGTVDPLAEVLSPDGRSHALSTSRGYDFGNEQPASSLLQKDWNQFVNLCFFSWFGHIFILVAVCFVPISWKVWWRFHYFQPPRNGGIGSRSTPC